MGFPVHSQKAVVGSQFSSRAKETLHLIKQWCCLLSVNSPTTEEERNLHTFFYHIHKCFSVTLTTVAGQVNPITLRTLLPQGAFSSSLGLADFRAQATAKY